MKVTVIQWSGYSPYLGRNFLTELAYPMRVRKEAEEMFRKEYPNSGELSSYEFDSDERPDIYEAFEHSGCIRFWKVY